jgi:class 3 adenylate cyclase
MYYAARDNFAAARALLEKSIVLKRRFADDAGLAIAYGNLGRLYLDWGLLDQAEAAFNEDLRLAEQVEDSRGAAQMYNSLGRVELERGNWAAAEAYLAHSVEAARPIEARVLEGFARRDLAWALAMQGNFPAAEEQAQAAGELFQSLGFQEGLAHVDWAWGRIFRLEGRAAEAQPRLQSAYRYFHTSGQWVAAARTRLEIAQALRAAGASDKVVLRELQEAMVLAERTRHDRIVTAVENELRDCSEVEYYRQLYRRAQGRDRPEERVSLTDGVRETASVLFLDLRGSTQYGLETDPEIVMTDFNQMMAGFAAVLKAEGVTICGYRGDGFMALARGRDHARRAVRAALKLFAALADFNRPRELLELAPLEVRIGINTGEVFLGNVGTYEKMEFAALGTAANLGARIESAAQPGLPAIGESTYQQVRRHCEFAPGNPRRVQAKGFQEGEIAVWDVLRCGES